MADARVSVTVTADTSTLTALNQELVAVSNTAKTMAADFKAAGLSSAEAGAALRSAGVSTQVMAAALKSVGYEAEAAAGKISGLERAEAMAVARGGAMAAGMGGLGMAMGRVAAQSPVLASALSAAFPVFLGLAAIDMLGHLASGIDELAAKEEKSAATWEKIENKSLSAIESENRAIGSLEESIVKLTDGELESLRLKMQLIGDGSVEMASKMPSLFEAIGKQIDEEAPYLDRFLRNADNVTNVITKIGMGFDSEAFGVAAYKAPPSAAIQEFGTDLSKTLDQKGTQAGLDAVDKKLNELYATMQDAGGRTAPANKALAEFAGQLEHVQSLLAKGLTSEAMEQQKGRLDISAEAEKETEKRQRMADEITKALSKEPKERGQSTAEKESEFFAKEQEKESAAQLRGLSERGAAEQKFQDDRNKGDEGYLDQRIKKIRELMEIEQQQAFLGDEIAAKGYAKDLGEYSRLLTEKRGIQREQLGESISAIGEEVSATEASYARQRSALQQQFSLKRISGVEFVREAQADAQAEYAAVSAALDREIAAVRSFAGEDVRLREEAAKRIETIEKQREKAYEAMVNAEVRAQQEAAAKQQQSIDQLTRSWGSNMSHIVNEVVMGRLTLRAAFADIGNNMILSLIDKGIAHVAQVWGMKLLEMIAMHVSFLAKLLGIQVAGNATQVSAKIAADTAIVGADAGAGSAAAFASVLEALPFPANVAAAPGVAAAEFAQIMAVGIPKFHGGGIVRADLETGEMVLPRPISTGLQQIIASGRAGRDGAEGASGRDGANGGRPMPPIQITQHNSAWDSAGLDRVLSRNSAAIERYVRSALRDGRISR
jgi:hypothetical protein